MGGWALCGILRSGQLSGYNNKTVKELCTSLLADRVENHRARGSACDRRPGRRINNEGLQTGALRDGAPGVRTNERAYSGELAGSPARATHLRRSLFLVNNQSVG